METIESTFALKYLVKEDGKTLGEIVDAANEAGCYTKLIHYYEAVNSLRKTNKVIKQGTKYYLP